MIGVDLIGEPCERIDTIELCRFEEAGYEGPIVGPEIGPCKKISILRKG